MPELPRSVLKAVLGVPAVLRTSARVLWRGELAAHSLESLRSLRACGQQLQPDTHAISAAWGCFSEVASLEFAQLRQTFAATHAAQTQGEDGGGAACVGEPLTWTPLIQLQWFAPFYSGGGYSSEVKWH